MISRRSVVALGAVSVLGPATGACTADVKTQSNVDKAYGKKLDRVLVALTLSIQNRDTYLKPDEVTDSLKAAFAAAGVTNEIVLVPSTGTTTSLTTATASFRPTQILRVRVTRLATDRGAAAAFTLTCEVYDLPNPKRVWLSTIEFEQAPMAGTLLLSMASKKAADNFAKTLIDRLRQDGLL